MCFLGYGAGEEGALLLAAGEFADLAVLEFFEVEGVQCGIDGSVIFVTIGPPPSCLWVASHFD